MTNEQITVGVTGTFATGIFLQHELSTHEVYNLLMKYKKENEYLRRIIEEELKVSEYEINEELKKMMENE